MLYRQARFQPISIAQTSVKLKCISKCYSKTTVQVHKSQLARQNSIHHRWKLLLTNVGSITLFFLLYYSHALIRSQNSAADIQGSLAYIKHMSSPSVESCLHHFISKHLSDLILPKKVKPSGAMTSVGTKDGFIAADCIHHCWWSSMHYTLMRHFQSRPTY